MVTAIESLKVENQETTAVCNLSYPQKQQHNTKPKFLDVINIVFTDQSGMQKKIIKILVWPNLRTGSNSGITTEKMLQEWSRQT